MRSNGSQRHPANRAGRSGPSLADYYRAGLPVATEPGTRWAYTNHRWVVERSLAWLVGYRRLQVRYERDADILLAFLHLACVLICVRSLHRSKR